MGDAHSVLMAGVIMGLPKSDNDLTPYLRDMRRHPVLERSRERRLAQVMRLARRAQARLRRLPAGPDREQHLRSWQRRYHAAREEFILGHLRLVIHVARGYLHHGLALTDLIQEGNVGLMRAVEKFDPDHGARFSTYAFWWIKQSIQRAIATRGSMIRIPVHKLEQRRKVIRAAGDLARSLSRAPSPAEIARRLRLSVETVQEILELVPEPRSLEDLSREDGPHALDSLADPSAASPLREARVRELHTRITSVLNSLSPRNAEVVRLRFGIGRKRAHTLAEIGQRLKRSRVRVRQIEAEALRTLRAAHALEGLSDG
jgi:RNA polymerase primary sigma factor